MFVIRVTVHIDELYCFFYKSTPEDLPKSAGWNFFDIQTEYQRMNVPNDQWVLCTANKDYEVSYKEVIYNNQFYFIRTNDGANVTIRRY